MYYFFGRNRGGEQPGHQPSGDTLTPRELRETRRTEKFEPEEAGNSTKPETIETDSDLDFDNPGQAKIVPGAGSEQKNPFNRVP
jgi:hypothetical protein